jgi:metallo-beta-lactamase class B
VKLPLAALLLCVFAGVTLSAHLPSNPKWNNPVTPFRIAGNLYYVGASDVTAYLLTTPQGDILLDGGLPETAPQIERNIQTLGFQLKDIKYLLNSHAHFDHAGGLAELKAKTGARMVASQGDKTALETGDRDDFTWGNDVQFPPVKVDEVIMDNGSIRLGNTVVTAHVTPGHTKGCTTWTTTVQEQGKTENVVFVCSTSAPGYKLVGNPKYPTIASDYERTFQTLRSLPCDIFLASHGEMFDLLGKRERMKSAQTNPFIAPADYRAYLDRSEATFRKELARQEKSATSPKRASSST